ncbi:hypothetical protein [Flindersiella endophytica]
MATTDEQVATLRAFLTEDREEYDRIWSSLVDGGEKEGYFRLLLVAFTEAVRAQFRGKTRGDMVEWIADLRASQDPGGRIDPGVAERLVLWVFGKGSTDGIDFNTEAEHQMMLLFFLLEEQGLDEPGLDAFLTKVRGLTDEIMS